MSRRLDYTKRAARDIRKLDPQVRHRVRNALERLAAEPSRGKPLQLNLRGLRSFRTGDYRIIYRTVDDVLEVLVIAVGHRREVYDHVKSRL